MRQIATGGGANSSSVMIQRSVIDIDSAFVFWVAQSVVINGVRLPVTSSHTLVPTITDQ